MKKGFEDSRIRGFKGSSGKIKNNEERILGIE